MSHEHHHNLSSSIVLPSQFCRNGSASLSELRSYVAACIDFLTSPMVSSILECHPNDVAVQGPDPKWNSWWQWAAAGKSRWTFLIPGWHPNISCHTSTVPESLKEMLNTVDSLTLPRKMESAIYANEPTLRGMSPKKSHEVFHMSSFIQQILQEGRTRIGHVVDVGAGQGYLSRILSSSPFSMNVLALDFSETQTKGAERRTSNNQKKKLKRSSLTDVPNVGSNNISQQEGSLAHETVHITPHTLKSTVSKWISDCCQSTASPIPVLFVALHACGSLTPDILRCFIENQFALVNSNDSAPQWYAAGIVVAGCCYNLMSPDSDFPLSELAMREQRNRNVQLHLSYNHRSLAAQSPLQWSLSPSTKTSAELAVRKIVYRALFNKFVFFNWRDTSSATLNDRLVRVGRLPDVAYSTLRNFVAEAERKTAYKIPILVDNERELEEKYATLMSCLEVLHALRCRIGPVIESLIIVDRYLYLVENLPNRKTASRNLFDQDLGSSRNVVLAVWP